MVDKAVSSFTLLAAPTFMVVGLVRHDWLFVALLAGWWWLSRSIKLLPHLRRRPSSLVLVPPFVLLSFVMAVVKLYALATVRTQRWLTRDVEVVGDTVVRTGTGAGTATGDSQIDVRPDTPASLFLPTAERDAQREQRA
jgi:hyaluronan synthase